MSHEFNIDGLARLKISEYLQNIVKEFHNHALILQRDDECDRKAHDRVECNHAPLTRGKSESKDCLIIEHYLKLVNNLRESSFSKNIVFITSNTTDFGKPQTPPLDTQFDSNNIIYCNNFQWAIQEADR